MSRAERVAGTAAVFCGALLVSLALCAGARAAGGPLQPPAGGLVVGSQLPAQTDVDRARHEVDATGIPVLSVAGVGRVAQPAIVALYALGYAGREAYFGADAARPDPARFEACITWLHDHTGTTAAGDTVWSYAFDSTYNDVAIKAPWYSGFAQAAGIQALLTSYARTQRPRDLELAVKAAAALLRPLDAGGLAYRKGGDLWFEEIPVPRANPPHILNGHLRALLALHELAAVRKDAVPAKVLADAAATAVRWMPLFDTGYALRYDLNPRKSELCFRLTDPYGDPLPPLAVHAARLRDPVSGAELALDVGAATDAAGDVRIAGVDWSVPLVEHGETVRRLQPVLPEPFTSKDAAGVGAPATFLYFKLPGPWVDNARTEPLWLTLRYFDDAVANVTVQMRSVAPGSSFRELQNGRLLCKGSKAWVDWTIPVRPADLGFWCGLTYAEKHAAYLEALVRHVPELAPAAAKAAAYLGSQRGGLAASGEALDVRTIDASLRIHAPAKPLPAQTPGLGFSLDANGVVVQHAVPDERDRKAGRKVGAAHYNPYVVSQQYTQGRAVSSKPQQPIPNMAAAEPAPALAWLKKKAVSREGTLVWPYAFDNTYNDVFMASGWVSSFAQAYVLEALVKAASTGDVEAARMVGPTVESFALPVSRGGVKADTSDWYEEVPNQTAVLNAQLASLLVLCRTARSDASAGWAKRAEALAAVGLRTLTERIFTYDTGYWVRYDLNRKNDVLLRFAMDREDAALDGPAIDSVVLARPGTPEVAVIDVGAGGDFDGPTSVSGVDWSDAETVDGRTTRRFKSGWTARAAPLKGASRHNSYVRLGVPKNWVAGQLESLPFHLYVTYKDDVACRFRVEIRNISEGSEMGFVPLASSRVQTSGRGGWKTACIPLHARDLGWFCGPDYQDFHAKTMRELAELLKDRFIAQVADRWEWYLEAQRTSRSPIAGCAATDAQYENPVDDVTQQALVDGGSPMYKGFGVANALDEDASRDYAAGVEGNLPQWFTLKFPRKIELAAVKLMYESAANVASDLTIEAVVDERKVPVLRVTGSSAQNQYLPVAPTVSADTLVFTATKFLGQERLLLRQIKVFERRPARVRAAPASDELLSSKDPRNPLSVWRMPLTRFWKPIVDELLKGSTPYTPHQKAVVFMDHSSRFAIGVASDARPETVVSERIGACGTFTNLFVALCAAADIPARILTLGNYPAGDGHAVSEVFYGGSWHCYDATYGCYYARRPGDLEDPGVLSFAELRARGARAPGVTRVVMNQRRVLASRPLSLAFLGPEIYEEARPAGVLSMDNVLEYPLKLDLRSAPRISAKDFGARNQGASNLGVTAANQVQLFTLTGLEAGKRYVFTATYGRIMGEFEDNEVRRFKAAASAVSGAELTSGERFEALDRPEGPPQVWQVALRASAPTAEIRLSHDYRGPAFRYMSALEYSLAEAAP